MDLFSIKLLGHTLSHLAQAFVGSLKLKGSFTGQDPGPTQSQVATAEGVLEGLSWQTLGDSHPRPCLHGGRLSPWRACDKPKVSGQRVGAKPPASPPLCPPDHSSPHPFPGLASSGLFAQSQLLSPVGAALGQGEPQGLGQLILGLELADVLGQHLQPQSLVPGLLGPGPWLMSSAPSIAPPYRAGGRGPRGPGRKKMGGHSRLPRSLRPSGSQVTFPLHRKGKRGSGGL